MEQLDSRRTNTIISTLLADQRRNTVLKLILISVVIFSLAPLLVLGGASFGTGIVLSFIVVPAIAALIVRWPVVGFYVVSACTVLIEQAPLFTPIGTDRLNIYSWPPALEGLVERPIGFLIIFIFFVFVCHYLATRQRSLRGGELLEPFLFYLLCVIGGILHGLSSGGDFKIIVVEVRPFWYLFLSYLLAYNLLTSKNQIRILFWIVILSAGVKSIQGVYIYLIVEHGNLDSQHAIMSHEESFFFVALILLLVLFCLHYRYRPQFYAALLVLPSLLVALVANQRRTDYIALIVGILVAWTIVFYIKPQFRKTLVVVMLVSIVLSVGYVIAFSHSTGVFAEPAREVVSIFNPDSTDTVSADSNAYRVIENYDLKYTALQNPLFGWGFGKKFLQPIILPDISALDPNYVYVPHNTIYWVWMRLGAIGFFALWYLFGTIIVRGCLIVRQLKDQYLQLVAIYIIGVTFMEIVVAIADYQLFFYRNVIYLGLLVGVLMKLPALDKKQEAKPL